MNSPFNLFMINKQRKNAVHPEYSEITKTKIDAKLTFFMPFF
jgi:hypothetical protein